MPRPINDGPVTVPILLARLREAEHDRRALEQKVERLSERVALAEKGARDAWAFTRGMMARPTSRI